MKIIQLLLSAIFAVAVAVDHTNAQDEAGVNAIRTLPGSVEHAMSPRVEGFEEEDYPFLRGRQLDANWCSPIVVQQQSSYPNKPTVYFKCPKNKNIKVCWKPKWKWRGICRENSVMFNSGAGGTCNYTFQNIPCDRAYKVKVHGGGRGTCSEDFEACL